MVDFTKLIKDGKYRNREDAQIYGARIFKRKFGGFFGKKRRLEQETLELIIQMGLATDESSARGIFKSLQTEEVPYQKNWSPKCFILEEIKNSSGGKAYRLNTDV